MTESDHERLRVLFGEAAALPEAARAAFLAARCGPDAALQQRLLAMLAGADDARFLANPTGELPVAPAASAAPAAVGERVGDR
ncbi:MAG: hypothetical protein WBO45_05245, partial [Planctomycetota bacterium]